MNLKELLIEEFLDNKICVAKILKVLQTQGFPFYHKENTIVSFLDGYEIKIIYNDLYIWVALAEIIDIKNSKIKQPIISLTYTDLFMEEYHSEDSLKDLIPLSTLQYNFYNTDIELINMFIIEQNKYEKTEFIIKLNKETNEQKITFYPNGEKIIQGNVDNELLYAIETFWQDGVVSGEETEQLDLSYDFAYHYLFPEIPDPFYNKIKYFCLNKHLNTD